VPNGKPGDHPFTDLLIHGWETFGKEITALVKEIDGLPGSKAYRDEIAQLLLENDPAWNRKSANLDRVKDRLLAIRAKLRTGAT
jgi:hypothetical protein